MTNTVGAGGYNNRWYVERIRGKELMKGGDKNT
jgi:hypothetical protein